MNGVYAVLVGQDISDEPVRFLFANEADADDFARVTEGAWVSYEPIAASIEDETLRECFPEEVALIESMREK